jgi:hemin uptake protein HemP
MSLSTTLSLPAATNLLNGSFPRLTLKPRAAHAENPARRVSSQVLLAGERELVIHHQGSEYHLRLTRNDKLILTK